MNFKATSCKWNDNSTVALLFHSIRKTWSYTYSWNGPFNGSPSETQHDANYIDLFTYLSISTLLSLENGEKLIHSYFIDRHKRDSHSLVLYFYLPLWKLLLSTAVMLTMMHRENKHVAFFCNLSLIQSLILHVLKLLLVHLGWLVYYYRQACDSFAPGISVISWGRAERAER